MTADLTLLHPAIAPLCARLMTDLEACGYRQTGSRGFAKVTTTYRTPATENALPSSVTAVTGSTSKHCFTIDNKPASKAFDITFFNADGSMVNDGSDHRYADAGAFWSRYAAESENRSLGLTWGGLWHKPYDPGHFQIM
jgi:hypothetical protein